MDKPIDIPIGHFTQAPVELGPGWIIPRGQALPVSEYPELYAVIKGAYGEDKEKGLFHVPDMGHLPQPWRLKAREADLRVGSYDAYSKSVVDAQAAIAAMVRARIAYLAWASSSWSWRRRVGEAMVKARRVAVDAVTHTVAEICREAVEEEEAKS